MGLEGGREGGREGGKPKLQKLPFGDKENGHEMGSTYLKSLVPRAGIEPARWKPPTDFKSNPWAHESVKFFEQDWKVV